MSQQPEEYVLLRDPGCWDMFPGAYSESQWYAMRNKPREMLQILKFNQTGFLATQMLHLAIFLIWCLATRVPGFNLYDGSEAANANTHSGWWLMADAMVLAVGLLAPYFTLHYIREGSSETVETGVKGTANWMIAYMVVAILGAVMTAVHAILSCLELRQCASSTFCNNYYYMQIALIVLLFVLTVLLLWSAALGNTYRLNIQGSITYGDLRPTIMIYDISATRMAPAPSAPTEIITEGGGAPAVPPSAGMTAQARATIMTPLLQMRMQGLNGKFRHSPGSRTTTLVGMK